MGRFNWLTQRLCALNILLLTVSMTPAGAITPVDIKDGYYWHDLGYEASNLISGCEVEIGVDFISTPCVVIHNYDNSGTGPGEPSSGGI